LARRILNEQLKGIEDHPEQILNIKPTEATKQAINALKRSYFADLFNSNDEMQVLVAKALKDVVKK
jgi:RecB family endonuclease NucS